MVKGSSMVQKMKVPFCETNYENAKMYDVKKEWLSKGWEKKDGSDPFVKPFREHFSYVASTDKSGETLSV